MHERHAKVDLGEDVDRQLLRERQREGIAEVVCTRHRDIAVGREAHRVDAHRRQVAVDLVRSAGGIGMYARRRRAARSDEQGITGLGVRRVFLLHVVAGLEVLHAAVRGKSTKIAGVEMWISWLSKHVTPPSLVTVSSNRTPSCPDSM
jgi:hypothetical protein